MPEILTDTVRLGVSACIDRCPVRYDGRAFDRLEPIGRERADFTLTPVCPECMAGFGVPRVPIHLTGGDGHDVLDGGARVKDRRGHDRTDDLIEGAKACMDALDRAGVEAVILKEKSPSCGVLLTHIGGAGGGSSAATNGAGVFGAMCVLSGRFVIPDTVLDDPLAWWDWRRRLHAWLWIRRREISSSADLCAAWHRLEFIVQATDRPAADAIVRALAALPKRPSPGEVEHVRERIADALRRPMTPARARQALWKAYVDLKKKGRLDGADLSDLTADSPEVKRSVTRIAQETAALERISFDNELLVGTSPVLRRGRRRVAALHARDTGPEQEA
jgi:uncharacterized protein YbbK (DUF523 family)